MLQTNIAPESDIGIEEIKDIEGASYSVIEQLRATVFKPDGKKQLDRRFTISEVARMIKRSTTSIRQAEKSNRLPTPEKSIKGRRRGYTLPEINYMREMFGTRPWRNSATDDPVIIAIQNFKGGVGKSTITAHLAQYLGLQGYRVCVLDCDPQGCSDS